MNARDEVQAGIPRSRDRKVGYVVAQLMGNRLLIEAFREADGDWVPSRVMTATTAEQLATEFFEALMSLGSEPDPITYGPRGICCGCGKYAHSNLVPCRSESEEVER
ncbi:hypothetical protein [Streptomyces sp. NPDC059708]|uniref:hypothetical protein n=1 Tax=Streptomyces sp. NPDC059708 TaxID=3346916 RepID=UPI0036A351F0